jgi:hypothetical protein
MKVDCFQNTRILEHLTEQDNKTLTSCSSRSIAHLFILRRNFFLFFMSYARCRMKWFMYGWQPTRSRIAIFSTALLWNFSSATDFDSILWYNSRIMCSYQIQMSHPISLFLSEFSMIGILSTDFQAAREWHTVLCLNKSVCFRTAVTSRILRCYGWLLIIRLRDTFPLLSTLYITEEYESMRGAPAYSICFSSHLRSLLRSHGSFVDM